MLDSTLQRQANDFFQNLTVEVAGSTHCAMVYALTWSSREALGNIGLLAEIDKLAARVDQLREPVTGEEVLHILHRRLLGEKPKETHAAEIASSYADVVTSVPSGVFAKLIGPTHLVLVSSVKPSRRRMPCAEDDRHRQ